MIITNVFLSPKCARSFIRSTLIVTIIISCAMWGTHRKENWEAQTQDSGCIKVESLFHVKIDVVSSYILWLEYVFKHALLCHHKIYIITRHEQISLFSFLRSRVTTECGVGVNNDETFNFSFHLYNNLQKLLEEITKTLISLCFFLTITGGFRLALMLCCERFEILIYCPHYFVVVAWRKLFLLAKSSSNISRSQSAHWLRPRPKVLWKLINMETLHLPGCLLQYCRRHRMTLSLEVSFHSSAFFLPQPHIVPL